MYAGCIGGKGVLPPMHRRVDYPLSSCRNALLGVVPLMLFAGLFAQAPASSQPTSKGPAPQAASQSGRNAPEVKAISEEQLRHQLQGKTFYLRAGYSDNDLRFDELGRLASTSPKLSYALSMVQIDRVHMSKHKVDLVGIRYGIHFLGAGPTEDPLSATDKVRITPKKKVLRISIDRAEVVKPKKEKTRRPKGDAQPAAVAAPSGSPAAGEETLTQARANQHLEQAIDAIFAPGLDDRMIASLPDFWQLFYHEAAAKTDYKPSDPSTLRQSMVDQKARLLTNFEPPSNDMAQTAGVAGVALYHVVVGRDGKPGEIAVGRPIGFGLDENAVDSIRKASFQPAMKGGQPVPVLLDLVVQFRIFSNRTAGSSGETGSAKVSETESPSLPGPYSANQPTTKQQ